MVVGVTDGYRQVAGDQRHRLPRAAEGQPIWSSRSASRNPVTVVAPAGITFSVERPDSLHIAGIYKQQVGEVAANIRRIRPAGAVQGTRV